MHAVLSSTSCRHNLFQEPSRLFLRAYENVHTYLAKCIHSVSLQCTGSLHKHQDFFRASYFCGYDLGSWLSRCQILTPSHHTSITGQDHDWQYENNWNTRLRFHWIKSINVKIILPQRACVLCVSFQVTVSYLVAELVFFRDRTRVNSRCGVL